MRKEIIIAIVVGFVLGLIITFGIYTANRAIKNKNQAKSNQPSPLGFATPLPSPLTNLEITEPENNSVVDKDKIIVSGKADPKTAIAILGEDFDDLVYSDNEGLFSTEVPLVGGANEIKIISMGISNEKQEKVLTIVYTTSKIE